jgi:hypothetical protein
MRRVSLVVAVAVAILGIGMRAEASGGAAPARAASHRCACGPGCPGGSKCCCVRKRTIENKAAAPARVAIRPMSAARGSVRAMPCHPSGSSPSADRVERDRVPGLVVAGARRPRRASGIRVVVPVPLDHASLATAPPDRPPKHPRSA